MKWISRLTVSAVLAIASLAIGAGAANAAWITDPTPIDPRYNITVKDSADTNNAGTSVRWRAKILCPKGERFSVGGGIRQQASQLAAPYATWTSDDTYANTSLKGTCSGKSQTIRLVLTVEKTTITSPTGAVKKIFVPIRPAPAAFVAQLYMSTPNSPDRGSPYYCSYVAVPGEDGTVCDEATQIGPTLRLT